MLVFLCALWVGLSWPDMPKLHAHTTKISIKLQNTNCLGLLVKYIRLNLVAMIY